MHWVKSTLLCSTMIINNHYQPYPQGLNFCYYWQGIYLYNRLMMYHLTMVWRLESHICDKIFISLQKVRNYWKITEYLTYLTLVFLIECLAKPKNSTYSDPFPLNETYCILFVILTSYLYICNSIFAIFPFFRHKGSTLLPQITTDTCTHGLQAIRHPYQQFIHAT